MYLTIKQVADRLGVSDKTIRRRIDDGTLPILRMGTRTIRINEDELKVFAERGKDKKRAAV